mmetsp:Transcript_15977/g.39252  ORF Transcript_15977/g.39252 Transcript_15977/m.39252 type:complete len:353 (+) Transcript_15977:1086-2144(+)
MFCFHPPHLPQPPSQFLLFLNACVFRPLFRHLRRARPRRLLRLRVQGEQGWGRGRVILGWLLPRLACRLPPRAVKELQQGDPVLTHELGHVHWRLALCVLQVDVRASLDERGHASLVLPKHHPVRRGHLEVLSAIRARVRVSPSGEKSCDDVCISADARRVQRGLAHLAPLHHVVPRRDEPSHLIDVAVTRGEHQGDLGPHLVRHRLLGFARLGLALRPLPQSLAQPLFERQRALEQPRHGDGKYGDAKVVEQEPYRILLLPLRLGCGCCRICCRVRARLADFRGVAPARLLGLLAPWAGGGNWSSFLLVLLFPLLLPELLHGAAHPVRAHWHRVGRVLCEGLSPAVRACAP